MKKVFSGIQPTGSLHIGNYIGAISQWVKMQDEAECLFCIVDLHAITIPQNPKILREKILEVAAIYLACGIDPEKANIFIQSENPDHPYLTWLLNCITPFGQLERMTQFKDKSLKQKDATTAGLFDYPVLMAADILLYDTDEVPVGDDQKQHIELTRDLAEKFNSSYGEVFKLPRSVIQKEKARIMSLQKPTLKMSKSDDDKNGTIFLTDSENDIKDKIKRAVTDSGSDIKMSDDKPAVSNLLIIYSVVSGMSVEELERKHKGAGYGQFKQELGNSVIEFLEPVQVKIHEYLSDKGELQRILDKGALYSREKSGIVLGRVKESLGMGR